MIKLPIFQIDAFTSRVFKGNPAAVVPLDSWLPDATLQAIAAENNLSETAYFVAEDDGWRLRWFTPAVEVDLCGHATLATAHLIFTRLSADADRVRFLTRSGPVEVIRENGGRLALDFPSSPATPVNDTAKLDAVAAALGRRPGELLFGMDYMAVFAGEADVASLAPDLGCVAKLGGRGMIVTAPGRECDFVSRFFGPNVGIPEDPVTGSAHCTLTPYWSRRLVKSALTARQISRRGGELFLEDRGGRTRIGGHAVLYLEGTIFV